LKIAHNDIFDDAEAVGGYVNIHVNAAFLAEKLLPEILSEKEDFAR
jgi:arginyl-tRNA synthetase